MAFAYPDYAKDIINDGKMYPEKVCVSCSACTQIMRDAGMTGCVVRDNEVYGPIFEHGRMSDRDNLARLASACRKCQEPTCRLGCPAGVDIPKFISQFLDGEEKAAYETLREANIFPEVCAWLCPVEQQCEGHCLQNFIGDGPLPIAEIQRYLAEQANRNGWSSCAAKLLEAGHTVTIFDASTEFGGMIASVIPTDRQSNSLSSEIAAIFADVPKERMILRLGKELNADFNLDNIIDVWNAMDFLSAARKPDALNLKGRTVAAIGGGNTAMDVATTARRLGARDVYVIYRRSFKEMPAWSAERDQAMNKGVHFLILTQPVGFNSTNGKLTGIKVCPTRLGEPDKSGRRRPETVESSAYVLDMDIVVEAIGQEPLENIGEILPGVELEGGLIRTNEGALATSRPGVYAGGDLVRGASTVVAAVADGLAAANEMNEFLGQ